MRYKAAYLCGPSDVQLKELEIPALGRNQVLVKLKAAGICGSDVECYLGRSKEGRYDIAPYVPGHEWSGEIVDKGADVLNLRRGDRVTGDCVLHCGRCDNYKSNLSPVACKNMREVGFMPNSPGGMGEYLVLEENYLHRFDDDMSYEEGALIEPFSVSYFAIWGHGGHVDASDGVVVFGAGPIGLFAAIIAKVAGSRVIVVDPIEYRRQIAKKLGVNEVLNPKGENVNAAILDLTDGRGADLVVEASGTDAAIASSVEVAGHNGRIRLVGHSIGRKVPVEIGMVIWKSLSVTGQAGSPFAFPKTIRVMGAARKMIDYSQIITNRFPLEKVREAFNFAVQEREKAIKVMVTM